MLCVHCECRVRNPISEVLSNLKLLRAAASVTPNCSWGGTFSPALLLLLLLKYSRKTKTKTRPLN